METGRDGAVTYTIETCPKHDDDHAPRAVRHQCTDYAEATLAFDRALSEIAESGGAVELVRHGADGSRKVKGVYRRTKHD